MKLLRKLSRRPSKPVEVYDVESEEDLLTASMSIDRPELVVRLPIKMLVMLGGVSFDGDHPYVRGLQHGAPALEAFFATTRPRTIADYFGLEDETRLGAALPPWEVPWYERMARLPPTGECGLSAEHGNSVYGPVTSEKLAVEMGRLTKTLSSIEAKGFRPDLYGYIQGHAMHAGSRGGVRFFVLGGKHRAAVMSYLGVERITVKFRTKVQRVVDIHQSRAWPLVRQNLMSQSLAEEIFLKYFDPRPLSPTPGDTR